MQIPPRHDRVVVPDPGVNRRERRYTFALPGEVLEDQSLSFAEKRAILAEWASDRSAVESYPTLRRLAGTTFPVTFASVMDARRRLDELAGFGSAGTSGADKVGQVLAADFGRRQRVDGAPK